MSEETPAQKRKRLALRNKYRGTVCAGCRSNYYNFPCERSLRGDVFLLEHHPYQAGQVPQPFSLLGGA